jgi:hypothetical protein
MRTSVAALWILLASCSAAAAQTGQFQSELGGTLTWLNLGSFNETATGFGGRLGYHLVDLLWIDAEANAFPADDRVTGRKLEAFAGAKIGGRSRVFGLFGKVRPGAIRFGNDFLAPGTVCIAVVPTPTSCLASRRALALDYGSVIEVYPAERSIIRFDIGTTYIWYRNRGSGDRTRTSDFQFTLGFSRRL